jgi:hypothetical protein
VDRVGGRPFSNRSYTIWLHGNTVGGNDKAKERRGGGVEFAFAEFAGQTVLAEPG